MKGIRVYMGFFSLSMFKYTANLMRAIPLNLLQHAHLS